MSVADKCPPKQAFPKAKSGTVFGHAETAENVPSGLYGRVSTNDQQLLADETAHLSPQTFGDELKKITVDAPVYASHRKIPYERDIESQIRNLRDRRARVLLEKNYTL